MFDKLNEYRKLKGVETLLWSKTIYSQITVHQMKKMIKVLGEDEKMDKDWEHFAQHFDKVHSDFVAVL